MTDLDDLAGSIRPQNDRQLDARVLSLANPDVAPIQRGGMEADDHLARAGMRIWTLFDSKVVGITKGVEDDGAHNGVLYRSVRLKADPTNDERRTPQTMIEKLFGLSGRVAIVTGGSRGLGAEFAEGLAEAGASVMLSVVGKENA